MVDTLYNIFNQKESICYKSHNEFSIRCRYCGDSDKPHSAHLYLGYSPKHDAVGFHCKKCSSAGLVSRNFLALYDFTSTEISELSNVMSLSQYNMHTSNSTQKTIKKISRTLPIPLQKNYETDEKLAYLNTRFDDFLNLQKYKIVLSIHQFLYENQIDKWFKEEWLDLLDDSYVGFLNNNGTKIIFRNVPNLGEKWHKRYYVIDLTENDDKTHYEHFYNPIVSLNLTKPINVRMSEGTFDAINIEQQLPLENSVSIAVLNKDYISKIEYCFEIFGIDTNIEIYIDSDHKDMRQFKPYKDVIKVYKPFIENDYGEKDIKISVIEVEI